MPAGYLGGNVSEIDSLLMGISANTKHERLAFDLLKTFTHDKEIQTDIYRFSYGASALRAVATSGAVSRILEENMDDDDKQYTGKLLVDILANGILLPKFRQYAEDIAIADNEIGRIISEKKDADNNLKLLQRTIQTKLEK